MVGPLPSLSLGGAPQCSLLEPVIVRGSAVGVRDSDAAWVAESSGMITPGVAVQAGNRGDTTKKTSGGGQAFPPRA